MRLWLVLGAGAVLLAAVVFGARSDFAWLGRSEAEWIAYPHAVRTTSYSARPLEAVFERDVELASEGAVAADLSCLGTCRVEIGGRELGDAPLVLPAGTHRVTLRAERSAGPPVAALTLRAGPGGVVLARTDASWQASLSGAVTRPAVLAAEPRFPPSAPLPDIPWGQVAALALGSLLLWFAVERGTARGQRAVVALVVLAWAALFAANARTLAEFIGFDADHHVEYVRLLMLQREIPSPRDGIQTYQPPLFYLISAGWLELLGEWPREGHSVLALRALCFALGLVQLIGLFACVRLALPGRDVAASLALLFAAALPLHLALFHAVSNEVLVAALSTCTVWALLWSLQRDEPTLRQGLLVGALAGAALLAKLSALVLMPVVLGALWLRSPRGRAAPACLGAILAVSGWYYVRIALEFGTPFVGNWDPRVGFVWWQDPGFRSLGDYLQFGGVLWNPWFAGFDGVWDGLYSTLFADGLASGEPSRLLGPPWDLGLTRVAVWLGLIPTALILTGLVRGGVAVWRRPDAPGLALAGLGVIMLVAFVSMTLRVPSYAQAKAQYLTPALAVLTVALALGIDGLRVRAPFWGRLAAAGLVAWAVVSYAAFWVDAGADSTLRGLAERALAQGRPAAARGWLDQVEPDAAGRLPAWAELGRCRSYAQQGRVSLAVQPCGEAWQRAPDDPDVLFHSAQLLRRSGDLTGALERFERFRAVAPRDARGPAAIAGLARRLGEDELAARAAREWLLFEPRNNSASDLLSALERDRQATP